MARWAREAVSILGLEWFVNAQFMGDYLMEVNPRISTQIIHESFNLPVLGVRLALNGRRTRMMDSTTWEEACSRLDYWVRQRSRWTKGYIQTYLAQQRRPFRLVSRLGLARAFSFHVMVGGTFLCLLINPIYWVLALLWFTFRWKTFGELFPYPLILWGLICLFVGNFLFVYGAVLATCKRGYYDLVKYCLLMPFYWVITSVGAWKGFAQLLVRPSYWEKTQHGLDLEPGAGLE